jgi:hypothetical protein
MKVDTILVLFEYFFEINRLGVARMVYDANKVAPFRQGKIFINRYVSNVYSMPALLPQAFEQQSIGCHWPVSWLQKSVTALPV